MSMEKNSFFETSTTKSSNTMESTLSNNSGRETAVNHTDLSLRLANFLGDEPFTRDFFGADLTIYVSGASFYCHKFILASSSEPFNAMLRGGMREAKESSVHIEEVDPVVFELVLRYLYTGVVELEMNRVVGLLLASELYAIQSLREICINYILIHAQTILTTEQITLFDERTLIELVQNDELQIREIDLLEAVVMWGESRTLESTLVYETLKDVIEHIRFPTMSLNELYCKVKPLAGIAVPESLLIEALFRHSNWGDQTGERMKPRINRARKKKRVSFTQKVSFQ